MTRPRTEPLTGSIGIVTQASPLRIRSKEAASDAPASKITSVPALTVGDYVLYVRVEKQLLVVGKVV